MSCHFTGWLFFISCRHLKCWYLLNICYTLYADPWDAGEKGKGSSKEGCCGGWKGEGIYTSQKQKGYVLKSYLLVTKFMTCGFVFSLILCRISSLTFRPKILVLALSLFITYIWKVILDVLLQFVCDIWSISSKFVPCYVFELFTIQEIWLLVSFEVCDI